MAERALIGWPRARALRDTADYLAVCRDSGDQVLVGCIYPWMRDLIVETMRAEYERLTEIALAKWGTSAELDRDLPTAEDVRGILAAPPSPVSPDAGEPGGER